MKYTRGQFVKEYYRMWEIGFLLPVPANASFFSVKYKKNHLDQYSRVTLKAVSISDALERACYAVTYASPWRPEDIDLHAVYDTEENLLWIDESFYDLVQKRNEFRGMERREFLAKFGATSVAILFGFYTVPSVAGSSAVSLSGTASSFVPPGEQLYTSPISTNWVVPSGVTSVCVVCIGTGGGGGGDASGNMQGATGGGGGALEYKNNYGVTPGGTVSVVVGANPTATTNGGNSSFGSIVANGGTTGRYPSNGSGAGGVRSYTGDGGGAGGGGKALGNGGSGGGAGGYSGKGGDGATGSSYGQDGVGGAGGGGGASAGYNGGSGGGVGLFGQGANGLGGFGNSTMYSQGNGGAGSNGSGTQYGGGGAFGNLNTGGAVRINWGVGRSFPSNAA